MEMILKSHKIKILILVTVAFLAYVNIYQNDFLVDDVAGIVKNQNIGNLGMSLQSTSTVNVINSIVFLLSGISKPAFHLSNTIFHIGNVVLVYILLTIISNDFRSKQSASSLAFPTALIYAVHPLNSEAVDWISAKPYLLYSFFDLISLILFILYTKTRSKPLILFSALSFFLGILSSEKAIILPLILASYLLLTGKIKKYFYALCLACLPALYFVLTFVSKFNNRVNDLTVILATPPAQLNPTTQLPTAISSYIELYLLPINLTLYHSYILQDPLELLLKLSVTSAFFLLLALSFKKNRLLFFFLLFFLISILPTLSPIMVGWVVAERYIYFGSIGLSLTLTLAFFKAKEIFKSNEIPLILYAFAIMVFVIITFERNSQWKSSDEFWPATVAKSNFFAGAHINMGDYYSRHGQLDEALLEFAKADQLFGGKFAMAKYNAAGVYLMKDDMDKALEYYKASISDDPNYIDAYNNIVRIYINKKDYDNAENWAKTALSLRPNIPQPYNFLGIISGERNELDKAKSFFEKAISLDPQNPNYKNNLRLTKERMGK